MQQQRKKTSSKKVLNIIKSEYKISEMNEKPNRIKKKRNHQKQHMNVIKI